MKSPLAIATLSNTTDATNNNQNWRCCQHIEEPVYKFTHQKEKPARHGTPLDQKMSWVWWGSASKQIWRNEWNHH